jgi:hypothetical protein
MMGSLSDLPEIFTPSSAPVVAPHLWRRESSKHTLHALSLSWPDLFCYLYCPESSCSQGPAGRQLI